VTRGSVVFARFSVPMFVVLSIAKFLSGLPWVLCLLSVILPWISALFCLGSNLTPFPTSAPPVPLPLSGLIRPYNLCLLSCRPLSLLPYRTNTPLSNTIL